MAFDENAPFMRDRLKLQSEYQTERLTIKLSAVTLSAKVTEYFIRNRDFLCEANAQRTEEFFTSLYQLMLLSADEDNFIRGAAAKYWIFENGGRDIIGMVALNNIITGAFSSCFLSYRMDYRYADKGYSLEAVEKLIDIAFNEIGLRRIEAIIMPRNQRSLGLVEQLGFVCEGHSRGYLRIRDKWEDHLHMTLMRT